jgi:hypothetical protein
VIALAAGVALAWRFHGGWLAGVAMVGLAVTYLGDLRDFRRRELTLSRENRTFFEKACALRQQVPREGKVVYEGGPLHMAAWGVEGVYHLCYSPKLVLAPVDFEKETAKDALGVLTWNGRRREIRFEGRGRSVAMSVFALDDGWFNGDGERRWSGVRARARLWQEPGMDELVVETHPAGGQVGRTRLRVVVDGEALGEAVAERAPWVSRWKVARVPAERERRVEFLIEPAQMAPGRPERYGLLFRDFRFSAAVGKAEP